MFTNVVFFESKLNFDFSRFQISIHRTKLFWQNLVGTMLLHSLVLFVEMICVDLKIVLIDNMIILVLFGSSEVTNGRPHLQYEHTTLMHIINSSEFNSLVKAQNLQVHQLNKGLQHKVTDTNANSFNVKAFQIHKHNISMRAHTCDHNGSLKV